MKQHNMERSTSARLPGGRTLIACALLSFLSNFAHSQPSSSPSAQTGRFDAEAQAAGLGTPNVPHSEGDDDASQPYDGPLNVVLLFADDLGYNDISLHGSRRKLDVRDPASRLVTNIPTPNIDSLAAQGVRFTRAYATAATCSPSRAGLLSGRYQQRFGFEFNIGKGGKGRGLPPGVTTLPESLQRAGYTTGLVGKWHLGDADGYHPLEQGFDQFFGFLGGRHNYLPEEKGARILRNREPVVESQYLTDAFAREAVNFIAKHSRAPFFLYVPFNAVHKPIQATKDYERRFPDTPAEQRTYFAMVSALDDAVGEILAAIDEHGLASRTLVIFTNDNGGAENQGDNSPLRFYKKMLFEGGIRVPMIMRWPGVTNPGEEFDRASSLLDLYPTILGAARLEQPEGLDGVDLRPQLLGKASVSKPDYLFWRNGPNHAVLYQGRWKLIQTVESLCLRKGTDMTWLYDLDADIGEQNNIAPANPKLVKQLQAALQTWAAELIPPAWPSRPTSEDESIDGVVYEGHL